MYERDLTDRQVELLNEFMEGVVLNDEEVGRLEAQGVWEEIRALHGMHSAPKFLDIDWHNEEKLTRLVKTSKLGRITMNNRTMWLKQVEAEQFERYPPVF